VIERFKRRMILPECNSKGILVLAVLFGMELKLNGK
tara:strand:- start:675 stop:782 length:108 start_codon:yes stop_codon:yes gene_type:complete